MLEESLCCNRIGAAAEMASLAKRADGELLHLAIFQLLEAEVNMCETSTSLCRMQDDGIIGRDGWCETRGEVYLC